jgi:hypothetical protein
MAIQKEVAWHERQVLIDGKPVVKLQGLKYKFGQSNEYIYGAGNKVLDINPGNEAPEGTLIVLHGDLMTLNKAAMAVGYKSIVNAPITIVDYYKPSANRPGITYTLVQCYISEFEIDMEQGAAMMKVSLPFKFVDLIIS